MKHHFFVARRTRQAPTPAFMKIEGRLVRPLPPEAAGARERRFWLVQPWVIVGLVIALTLALMIPGLLLDLTRGF